VLEVARRLKEKPPQNIEVFFAWWGAEELGLFGSRQFVRRFHTQLDKDKLYLVNVDCVGVGELLTVHTGQGVVRRKATDPATVERVERIAARRGVKTIRAWESIISGGSSDHAGWVDRGYKHAISLLRENYRPLSLPAWLFAALLRIPDANQLEIKHIHSPDDVITGINPQILEETTDIAEAYVREIDQESK
jgi:Zn-dependent M28 family amino/carboxypeptidase